PAAAQGASVRSRRGWLEPRHGQPSARSSGRGRPPSHRIRFRGCRKQRFRVRPEALVSRRYVVLGNGIAGQTCAEDLRKADPDASIVIIAAERHPLYNRVALPRYLRGQVRREKVFMRTAEDSTNRGQEFKYDALLVATGGRPKP